LRTFESRQKPPARGDVMCRPSETRLAIRYCDGNSGQVYVSGEE
jgi:hypothetical protein